MEEFEVTIRMLIIACTSLVALSGGVSVIIKMFNPFRKLSCTVEEHTERLIEGDKRMNAIEGGIKTQSDADKIICKSLLVLLSHEVTGNSIDRIKEVRDELEQYLINK